MLTHVHATALCFSLENSAKVSTRTTQLSFSSCAIVENAVGTVHDLFYLMLALCSENAIQHTILPQAVLVQLFTHDTVFQLQKVFKCPFTSN